MAEVNIHYFSGTGNTKRAVDVMAASLQQNGYEVRLYLIGKDNPELTAVYGGNSVQALPQMERLLKRKGFDVFLTGGALYPNNWTQMTNPPSAVEAREISAGGDKMALAFAENFRHGGGRLHGIGRFIFFLGGFPVLNKLLAWSVTKRYNRYVAPGFNPTAKKSEGV